MTERKFQSFPCAECGHEVSLQAGVGRERQFYRGFPEVALPDEFELPTCTGCGEIYYSLDKESSAMLRKAQTPFFREWQAGHVELLVSRLQAKHGVTRRVIAGVCGVTPSYISHLINRTETASSTLLRFLEALVASPSEFSRHKMGRPFAVRGVIPADFNVAEGGSEALWASALSPVSKQKSKWSFPPSLNDTATTMSESA